MGINKDSHSSFLLHLLTLLLVAAACAALLVILYHCMTVRLFNRNTAAASSNNNISHRRRTPLTRGREQTPSTVFENSLDELIPAHKYHRKGPPPGTVVGVGGGGGGGGGEGDKDDGMCAVCLCEFEEGEELRTMPECVHSFHVACIDMWLFSHSTCPVCRKDPTPSPSPSPQYMLRPFLDSGLEGSAMTRPANNVVPNLVVHLGSVMMV